MALPSSWFACDFVQAMRSARLRARGAVRLTAIVASDDSAAICFWQASAYTQQLGRARFVRPAAI